MRLSLALALAGLIPLAACSSTKSEPTGLPSDADAIVVTHDASSISVENKLPERLLGVRIELTVSDVPQPYIFVVPSIEKGARGDAPLASFKTDSADVLVDPSSVHPTQVTIKARDTYGKPHETSVPW